MCKKFGGLDLLEMVNKFLKAIHSTQVRCFFSQAWLYASCGEISSG
jgi:hypothetical protein